MRRIILLIGIVLAAVALLPQPSLAQGQMATVRVMHASPDAPNVDVFVDGQQVLADVPYFQVSDKLMLSAGLHRVQIAPVAAGAGAAFYDGSIKLNAGRAYTIAVIGYSNNLIVLPLQDDQIVPPQGQARIRVIHASPNAPPIDISIADAPAPLLTDQYYTSADYVNVPAGSYPFELTASNNRSTPLFRTLPLRLESGWTYSLVVTGAGANDAWVQVATDQVR